jgi:heptosyltransferase-3
MTYGNYPPLDRIKRALVIKMRHHGDVLLTSPLFSELKKAIPDAEIDAFIYTDTLPMLEGHPAITSFHLYDKAWKSLSPWRKLKSEIALFRAIRKRQYDLVINLTEGDRGAIAALLSGSFCRVGFDPKGKGLLGKRKVYTHVIKQCPHPRHTVERQLDALRAIGIFPQERELYLDIPEAARQRMEAVVVEQGWNSGDYVLIHPVSRWRFKCLSTQQMAELIRKLHAQGEKVVISSGPDALEIAMVDEILNQVPGIPVLNCAGQLSLKELSALIAAAKALICVDSVPLHIASAVKTPVVALFGPTSEQNWGPWRNPRARVVAQRFSCRPCYQDGCGGSKMSDCLFTLPVDRIVEAFNTVAETKEKVTSEDAIEAGYGRSRD